MRKVVKFGGSSLASAQQFKKVAEIVHAEASRRYVVPSAPGKRFRKDTKVTDMLYGCYALAEQDEDFSENLHQIEERYQEIIDGLSLTLSLADEFAVIEKNFRAHAGKDYAASRGEYLNGIVMAAYLGYEFVDAAQVVFFKENGEFDAVKTNEVLGERLQNMENAVVPGFYGANPDGSIRTFSRGGSDITGSIVAKAVHAGTVFSGKRLVCAGGSCGCLRKLDGRIRLFDCRPEYHPEPGKDRDDHLQRTARAFLYGRVRAA